MGLTRSGKDRVFGALCLLDLNGLANGMYPLWVHFNRRLRRAITMIRYRAPTPSIELKGMEGRKLPVVLATFRSP